MKAWASLLGTIVLFAPSLASAHVVMTEPTPRSGENGLTTEPCGDVAAGAPTQFMAGETISVGWSVMQSHGGTLRIDFSEADDTGFETHVLAMDISDAQGMPTSMDIELPNINCDACTLRVIQVNPKEANYVSCADVQLMGATEGSTGGSSGGDESSGGGGDSTGGGGSSTGGSVDSSGDGNASASASASGASVSASGGDDAPVGDDGSGGTVATGDGTGGTAGSDEDSGGCSIGTGSGPSSAWLLLGALGLWVRRRNR